MCPPRLLFPCIAAVSATLLLQTVQAAEEQTATNQSAKLALYGKRNARVHDPSTLVKCKDEFWFFFTGRGIQSYHSKDLITWERGPRIFTNALPWTAEAVPGNRNVDCWAPDVIYLKDRYWVYYSVSTFGKNTSAIGVVSNPTLDPSDPAYQWTDHGPVVQSNDRLDYNAIDPSVILDADGKLWMAFGSFWSGIKMIQLDPATGKRVAPDSPMYSLAHSDSIEAACIYYHDGYYYLFLDWGLCCKGVDSTYNMRVGRSKTITGPYLDKAGKDLLYAGGTAFLETDVPFIGPGHAGILAQGDKYWLSYHFYDGTQRGAPSLAICPLKWGGDGWPIAERMPAATAP